MRRKSSLAALVVAALMILATPAFAAIVSFDATPLEPSFGQLTEIDFETLSLGSCNIGDPRCPPLVTSIRIGGVTFRDPVTLGTGFCSVPTCSADPDNPDGGNVVLFMSPGGSITFSPPVKLVVLDVQGIGDNPFDLFVTGGANSSLAVSSQGVLFGRVLLGLRSDNGIKEINLTNLGGTGGPIVFARVLYSKSGL